MEELSAEIVERVAEAEGVEPSELETPLFEVVDPDALEQVFSSMPDGPDRQAGEVRFEYYGYQVTVTAHGDISLTE